MGGGFTIGDLAVVTRERVFLFNDVESRYRASSREDEAMENWSSIIIGLILGIPLSYLVNLTTPWMQSNIAKSVFVSRQKRLKNLRDEYEYKKRLAQNPVLITPTALRNLLWILIALPTDILIFVFILFVPQIDDNLRTVLLVAQTTGFLFGFRSFVFQAISLITDTLDFENYKKRKIDKIMKLGGNPEDLDKEETPNE
jgi:hypothetical protein